jgi:hypothetical protein
MIAVKTILSSWITDIGTNLKTSLGLNTIAAHEPTYDLKTLAQLMPLTPAILLRYETLNPLEQYADGGSAMRKLQMSVVFLAESLLSPDEARAGCLDMIDAFRSKYDGGTIVIGNDQIDLKVEREGFLESDGGVLAYYAVYSFEQN